jgi:hypothetical protein
MHSSLAEQAAVLAAQEALRNVTAAILDAQEQALRQMADVVCLCRRNVFVCVDVEVVC